MVYALRSPNGTGTAGNASSSGTLTLTKPSGVADGDLLVVTGYLESDVNTWTTVPAGWTQDSTALQIANTGAFKTSVFWKVAASEPASWDWKNTTAGWRILAIAAFTGATGGGSTRVDGSGGSQADGVIEAATTAPSVVLPTAADLLTYNCGNFGGNAVTGVTGASTSLAVQLGGCAVCYKVLSSSGATGTSHMVAGGGTEDYAALHVGWLLAGSAGGAAASAFRDAMTLMGTV